MIEQDDSEVMFTLAEAVGDVVHSVNNHLNSLLLQAAILQMKITGEASEPLELMRQEAKAAAGLLRSLQAVRPWPARGEQADLVEAARLVSASHPNVDVELPDHPVLMDGSPMGLQRVVCLLMRLGERSAQPPNRPLLTVAADRLQLTVPGASLITDEEGKPALPVGGGPGLPDLEQRAARWLVRQVGRRLDYEEGPAGAVLVVRW